MDAHRIFAVPPLLPYVALAQQLDLYRAKCRARHDPGAALPCVRLVLYSTYRLVACRLIEWSPPVKLFTRRRPRYADVAATLALIVALGGTSYAVTALPRNSVGTKQLKPNAVTSAKVLNGSLFAKDFARGQLPSGGTGATGPKGDPGAKGDAGLQGPRGPAGLVAALTGFTPSGTFMPAQVPPIDVVTLSLTAGSYMLYGDVVFHNTHATTHDMTCGLGAPGFNGSGGSAAQIDKQAMTLPPGATGSISAMGPIQIGFPTTFLPTVTLSCYQSGVIDAGTIDFEDADIVAIPVDLID